MSHAPADQPRLRAMTTALDAMTSESAIRYRLYELDRQGVRDIGIRAERRAAERRELVEELRRLRGRPSVVERGGA